MLRLRRLRTRILLSFTVLIVSMQGIGFALVNQAGVGNAREQIEAELVSAERIFARLLELKREQLLQAADLLAADHALREAVAARDAAAAEAALRNHAARVGADAALLVGLDRNIVADAVDARRRGRAFAPVELIDAAHGTGRAATVAPLDERAYQFVTVALSAPKPGGWVVLGFEIDDVLAAELRQLTELHVSFFGVRDGGAPVELASTLTGARRSARRCRTARCSRGRACRSRSAGPNTKRACSPWARATAVAFSQCCSVRSTKCSPPSTGCACSCCCSPRSASRSRSRRAT